MKKSILLGAVSAVLFALNSALGDPDKLTPKEYQELFEHARTWHRNVGDEGCLAYLCPLCPHYKSGGLRVRNRLQEKDAPICFGKFSADVQRDERCRMCCRKYPSNEVKVAYPNLVFEVFHIRDIHRRCFVCFESFEKLDYQAIREHLWEHNVCEQCDYIKFEDKKKHLCEVHGCNCKSTSHIARHEKTCASRSVKCPFDDKHGFVTIDHFRKMHGCVEGCWIVYNPYSGGFFLDCACCIQCPECLKWVSAGHMKAKEGCKECCKMTVEGWKHDINCKHYIACDLCTNGAEVCATPLHMQSVHGCGLDKTGCIKENGAWKHGEGCNVLRCWECGVMFDDPEVFVAHMRGEYQCICGIISSVNGHDENCPCRKECPVSPQCIVTTLIQKHMKTAHKEFAFCYACKQWCKVAFHMRYVHECSCGKGLNEIHAENCVCRLRCPFCEKFVSWDHAPKEHGCGEKCRVFRPLKYEEVNGESGSSHCFIGYADFHDWKCFEDCGNYFSCPLCSRNYNLQEGVRHMRKEHGCLLECRMIKTSKEWKHADGCKNKCEEPKK